MLGIGRLAPCSGLIRVLLLLLVGAGASACTDGGADGSLIHLRLGSNHVEGEPGSTQRLVWVMPAHDDAPLFEDLEFSSEPSGAARVVAPERVVGRYFKDGMNMIDIGTIEMESSQAEIQISLREPDETYSGFPAILRESG